MPEHPPTFCKHCGARITSWVNDIPWCTSRKCIKRLYAILESRAGGEPTL